MSSELPAPARSSSAQLGASGGIDLKALETDQVETLATFAGGVAHDFNNLLTGIMGYHELIACELAENTSAHDYILHARSACLRARDLLDEILGFARQTSSAPHEAIDLGPLIESTCQQLGPMLPARVAIEAQIAPGLTPVPGNAAQLRLALLNLILHVARPLASAGGTIRVRLRGAGAADAGHAAFAILTPGPYACLTVGNVPDFAGTTTKQQVFDRSFTTTEMRRSGNLGIAVVFRIIRSHHGVLGKEHGPGGGEEFRVYLPFAASARAATPNRSEPKSRHDDALIFVVDDEETVVTFMRYALQAQGYRVQSFTTAEACLEALQAAPAACMLLITDQGMPGLTGTELVVRARALAPQLRAMVISGNTFDVPSQRDRAAVFEVIPKPFTTDELAVAVRRILQAPAPAG